MTFTEEQQRDRWKPGLTMETMSSEDSATEGDDEVILVRPLPWRSDQLSELMKMLDEKTCSGKSALAKRQAKRRVSSMEPSSRARPASGSYPGWVFKKQ